MEDDFSTPMHGTYSSKQIQAVRLIMKWIIVVFTTLVVFATLVVTINFTEPLQFECVCYSTLLVALNSSSFICPENIPRFKCYTVTLNKLLDRNNRNQILCGNEFELQSGIHIAKNQSRATFVSCRSIYNNKSHNLVIKGQAASTTIRCENIPITIFFRQVLQADDRTHHTPYTVPCMRIVSAGVGAICFSLPGS